MASSEKGPKKYLLYLMLKHQGAESFLKQSDTPPLFIPAPFQTRSASGQQRKNIQPFLPVLFPPGPLEMFPRAT